jgi:hypothetical protein
MAPSCSLDDAGLRLQYDRYREAGSEARLVERSRKRLVVDLDKHVDAQLVARMLAVERECCPFFTLGWQPRRRRLSVSVSQAEHAPALDAIASALGLDTRAQHSASD